jgi:hypothetical protein
VSKGAFGPLLGRLWAPWSPLAQGEGRGGVSRGLGGSRGGAGLALRRRGCGRGRGARGVRNRQPTPHGELAPRGPGRPARTRPCRRLGRGRGRGRGRAGAGQRSGSAGRRGGAAGRQGRARPWGLRGSARPPGAGQAPPAGACGRAGTSSLPAAGGRAGVPRRCDLRTAGAGGGPLLRGQRRARRLSPGPPAGPFGSGPPPLPSRPRRRPPGPAARACGPQGGTRRGRGRPPWPLQRAVG